MKQILLFAFTFLSLPGWSQPAAERVADFNLGKNKLAIEGYDPVAYFTQQRAIKGSKEFAAFYLGVLYYFKGVENKILFEKNPEKYLPEYGGWCAYAMGDSGEKVEVDPETFKVVDGKLFLFYNKYFNNTLQSWNKDELNLHRKADANWAKITAED